MESVAAVYAYKTLRHLENFEFAYEQAMDIPFGLPYTEQLVGVYRNLTPRVGDVWVTTRGLHLGGRGGPHMYVPYIDIRSARISDADAKPSRHLVLFLEAGIIVLVPILGIRRAFSDSYSLLRFVVRMTEGRMNMRARRCRYKTL